MARRLRTSGALRRMPLSMVVLAACAEPPLPDEPTQSLSARAAVVAPSTIATAATALPITIALTAPARLSPLQPVLEASESVVLEPGAEVLDGITVALGKTSASGTRREQSQSTALPARHRLRLWLGFVCGQPTALRSARRPGPIGLPHRRLFSAAVLRGQVVHDF